MTIQGPARLHPCPLNQLSSTYGRINLFEYSQFTILLCSEFSDGSISSRIELKVYMLFLGPESTMNYDVCFALKEPIVY